MKEEKYANNSQNRFKHARTIQHSHGFLVFKDSLPISFRSFWGTTTTEKIRGKFRKNKNYFSLHTLTHIYLSVNVVWCDANADAFPITSYNCAHSMVNVSPVKYVVKKFLLKNFNC